jgi:hypothetical protein
MVTLDDIKDYLDCDTYTGYLMACCQYHDDHHPSMVITERGYKCKSCGAHGSLNKLYADISGKPVLHQKRSNPSAWIWHKWEERWGNIKNIATTSHKCLINDLNLGKYLFDRGLGEKEIKEGNLGYLDGYFTFPVKNNFGMIVGMVARASPTIQSKYNRYTATKDCSVKLYVPKKIDPTKEIHVCFGTIDAWSLSICGYQSATGLAGQAIRPEYFNDYRVPIWIIPDKGEEKSGMELQVKLGWRGRMLNIDWPEGCKDCNDVHKTFGHLTLYNLVEHAKEKWQYGTQKEVS